MEKPTEAKMGSRMPVEAPKRGLLIERATKRDCFTVIVCQGNVLYDPRGQGEVWWRGERKTRRGVGDEA